MLFGSLEKGTFEARTIEDIKQCHDGTSLYPTIQNRIGERITLPYETKGIFAEAVKSVNESNLYCDLTDETLDKLRAKHKIKKIEPPENSMK